jgi:signal transduction histidine kinase/ActR/RegA family two-component response regulator/methyl-accepting chemotaxis protein
MARFFNFRTKQKSLAFQVGIGFSLIGIVLLGALLITLWSINKIGQQTSNLINLRQPIAGLELSILDAIHETQELEKRQLTLKDPELEVKKQALWENIITPAQRELGDYIANWQIPEIMEVYNQVVQKIKTLNSYQKELQQVHSNNEASAQTLLEESAKLIDDIKQDFMQISSLQNAMHAAALANEKLQIDNLFYTDWAFLILGTLLCAILGLILTKSMTNPIYRLVNIAKELAKGNLDQNIQITETLEFEKLSTALNEMVATLQNLAKVTEAMAMGDYNHRVQVKSSEDRLAITVNQMLENFNQIVNQTNAIAKGDYTIEIMPRSDKDILGLALQNMAKTLQENKIRNKDENWLKDGVTSLANTISGIHDVTKLCHLAASTISRYLEAGIGAIYIYDDDEQKVNLTGTYAFIERDQLSNKFALGEGIVGQVAKEQKPIFLKNIRAEDCIIETGTVAQAPHHIYAFPLNYESQLLGVVELGALEPWSSVQLKYIEEITPMLATQIRSAEQQSLTQRLLHESKLLTNRLQAQQDELQKANEELAAQTQELKQSEEALKQKDEQQRAINKKLAERTQELEKQKAEIEEKTEVIRRASEELKKKAMELEKASAYKSEFLANMSHELRTPLNSLLILAKMLADNDAKNLNAEQVESSKIILQSGQDLLTLINDILDLAKVEAGKIELHFDKESLSQFTNQVGRDFNHVAEKKGIKLITQVDAGLPENIYTDSHRLGQIIRNLVSNAIKFTEQGDVRFTITKSNEHRALEKTGLYTDECLAFSVKDSGIGIPKEKQKLIFESFQQADTSTSRKYGGTGLGLTISTQLAHLLGGEIELVSEVGQGSNFTLYLPLKKLTPPKSGIKEAETVLTTLTPHTEEAAKVSIDTDTIENQSYPELLNKKILLVDDDMRNTFALSRVLKNKGMEVEMASNGKMAIETLTAQPDIDLVLMDIMMPIMDGYQAIEQIRKMEQFKDLTIIALTAKAMQEDREKCIQIGASDFLAKPIDTEKLLEIMSKAMKGIEHS